MSTGTVKWFNADQGFGFIKSDDNGKDLFFDSATALAYFEQEDQRRSHRRFFSLAYIIRLLEIPSTAM